jgi:hypothetical protein
MHITIGNIRKNLEKLAEKHDAVPVVVWVKTPRGIANRRAVEREEATDSPKFDFDKVQEITMRHLANFDEPESDEKVISIDGMVPFEEQVASYNKQLKSILGW